LAADTVTWRLAALPTAREAPDPLTDIVSWIVHVKVLAACPDAAGGVSNPV